MFHGITHVGDAVLRQTRPRWRVGRRRGDVVLDFSVRAVVRLPMAVHFAGFAKAASLVVTQLLRSHVWATWTLVFKATITIWWYMDDAAILIIWRTTVDPLFTVRDGIDGWEDEELDKSHWLKTEAIDSYLMSANTVSASWSASNYLRPPAAEKMRIRSGSSMIDPESSIMASSDSWIHMDIPCADSLDNWAANRVSNFLNDLLKSWGIDKRSLNSLYTSLLSNNASSLQTAGSMVTTPLSDAITSSEIPGNPFVR